MLISSLGSSFIESLRTQLLGWAVTALLGFLVIFPRYFMEKIKFALNRADLRVKQYEELAADVSQYISLAGYCAEFIHEENTPRETLAELNTKYNDSIMTLKKKEFVFLSWMKKFWGEEKTGQFERFMKATAELDSAFHSLNDEFAKVILEKKKPYIDRKRATEALEAITPALEAVRKLGHELLATAINITYH